MQIEVNDYDALSNEARTRRAEEYIHRKQMEQLDAEYRWTCLVVNTGIAAVVAAVLAMAAMAVHAWLTIA